MQKISKNNHSLGYILRNLPLSYTGYISLEHFVGEIVEERNQATICPNHCESQHSLFSIIIVRIVCRNLEQMSAILMKNSHKKSQFLPLPRIEDPLLL